MINDQLTRIDIYDANIKIYASVIGPSGSPVRGIIMWQTQ